MIYFNIFYILGVTNIIAFLCFLLQHIFVGVWCCPESYIKMKVQKFRIHGRTAFAQMLKKSEEWNEFFKGNSESQGSDNVCSAGVENTEVDDYIV